MQTGCHNVHFQLPKMLIDSRKQLLSTAAAISHASGQRMGMRMGRRWRWRWRRGGASNLINVATNGLWRCRLRPVTFYVIKKRAQAGEQQQEIHTHTHTHTLACLCVCTCKKENYKIYAHWPQRVPKRVPSRRSKGSGWRQTTRGKRLLNFASCPAVANAADAAVAAAATAAHPARAVTAARVFAFRFRYKWHTQQTNNKTS